MHTHIYVHIEARHTVNISPVFNDSEPIILCVPYVHCVMCVGQKQ